MYDIFEPRTALGTGTYASPSKTKTLLASVRRWIKEEDLVVQSVRIKFGSAGSGLVVLTEPAAGRQVVCGGNTTKWKPSDGRINSGGTNWWPVNGSLCAGFELKVGGAWTAAAAAPTVGADGSSIEICAPAGATALRYAQSDWPLVTLYSREGMPAAPFAFPEEEFVGPH